ncbi:polysaccharide biosynthesis/export family protein [Flavobacterium sp. RSSB_23]|uniref:polysaccharide biosynthesis/export family protein n=1 Tax=Flavobacterium sp. RSSB_23 TaxID=3447668 RepID=UPI003F36FCAC
MSVSPIIRGMLFLIVLFLSSCSSNKQVLYYQDSDTVPQNIASKSYEITFQPDDLLMIVVSAENQEVAAPFNLTTVNVRSSAQPNLAIGQETQQLYLVDVHGNIQFPVLGAVKVAGLTRTQLLQDLQNKIGKYIQNPIITIRLNNFKVSLQGEVNAPGTYTVDTERITLIEALSKARDLTIYGKRNNVLVIRELDGVKTFNRIDLTKADFVHSPFYYLAQNDVVYVEPNKVRVNSSAVGPNTGVIISATSLLITLIALLVR